LSDIMNCKDCEERMSDYLERTLENQVRSAVEAHLRSCGNCSELFAGIAHVIETGKSFPVHDPPLWMASRIVANTPAFERKTLRAAIAASWRSLGEPRTALAIFTAAVVFGWVGGETVREAIFNKAESVMSCTYDRAIRSYYRSPVIIEIHSRFDQLLENS
jgi:predicted anti-sigma-YlaC factor YlaD